MLSSKFNPLSPEKPKCFTTSFSLSSNNTILKLIPKTKGVK